MALLFAATATFTPLAVSAGLFLRLPPVAPALGPLGWPAGAPRTEQAVLLEPDARHAWFVAPPRRSEPAAPYVACRVELASLRPSQCHELDLRPRKGRGALHHAFGDGALALVADEGDGRDRLALAAVLLRPGAPPATTVRWADGGGGAAPATLLNVAWRARAGRFEAYLARPGAGAAYELWALALGGAAAPAPEPLRPGGVRAAPGATPLAVGATDPPGVLWATGRELVYDRGDSVAPLPCRESPVACAAVASPVAPEGRYVGSSSLWFDGRGEVRPLAPHFASSERWRQVVHVAVRLSDDGGSSPLASRSVADEVAFGRLEASDVRGEPISVLVARGGLERVLVVVGPDGARHRVAREAGAPYEWTAVPHAGGLALVNFGAGRGVSLDASYRPRAPRARLAELGAVTAGRARLAPASVAAFFAALVAYPTLALWAACGRRDGAAGRALARALAAYAALVALFLWRNYGYLFPP